MKEFFKSKRFLILVVVLFLIIGYIVGAARMGSLKGLTSDFIGFVTAPAKKASASISAAGSSFLRKFVMADAISRENERLREENQDLKDRLIEYEATKQELEELKKYTGLQDKNSEQVPVSGMVIARDPDNKYCSFSIDVGTLDGVKKNDPVITSHGLVGLVWEANLSDSRVKTILDPSINVGVYSSKTFDVGIVEGTLEYAIERLTKMRFIPNESQMAVGDTIISSGVGGTFPKGITVGTVKEIGKENTGTSKYAVIEPAVDITSIKEVIVIISFRGQASQLEEPENDDSGADS
ncbi:MAG: rod shape-determining protein MreC [Oscillospiraceae bacterium]|nr:rod shape-determining protein MreC [Oscillospiraceae bacterium]